MSKKILVISTSPRKGGNSETLADAFIKGAFEAGNLTEKVCLYDKTIGFCKGCLACQKTKRCVISDDVNAIVERMRQAAVLVFATPVYFYDMCGQMKTLLDRSNPLFPAEYQFRDVYLVASAAEEEETAIDGTITGLSGWISCFEQARLAGVIRGVGLTEVGAAQKAAELVAAAYEMGKSV